MSNKRKSNPCIPSAPIPLNSLDAALDLLVCDTFARLETIAAKFEACAGVKLNDGVCKARWEEAIKRYWVMKSMDELWCGSKKEVKAVGMGGGGAGEGMEEDGDVGMDGAGDTGRKEGNARPLPSPHPGAVATHGLTPDEEREWRRWVPKVGDVVLVETAEDGFWPGKIIDKKIFFQGRTTPRGNHFFPVRIYNEDMSPSCLSLFPPPFSPHSTPTHQHNHRKVASRAPPSSPYPPLLASPALLSAYHHASNPTTFDMLASVRESLAAHNRTHPGVSTSENAEDARAKHKAEKVAWNQVVNWVMNERRMEKLRATGEERERRLREVARSANGEAGGAGGELANGDGCAEAGADGMSCDDEAAAMLSYPKKRRTSSAPADPPSYTTSASTSIFGPPTTPTFTRTSTPPRPTTSTHTNGSPSLASFIRPALSSSLSSPRPGSPRRTPTRDKRRASAIAGSAIGAGAGFGDGSPGFGRRMASYTPPRILPSGDETAPLGFGNGGGARGRVPPEVAAGKFDFVSPLGPVKMGMLSSGTAGVGSPGLSISLSAPSFGMNRHGPGNGGGSNGFASDSPPGHGRSPATANGDNVSGSDAQTPPARIGRAGSLEVVREEEEEDGWTVVQRKSGMRAGSEPAAAVGAREMGLGIGVGARSGGEDGGAVGDERKGRERGRAVDGEEMES